MLSGGREQLFTYMEGGKGEKGSWRMYVIAEEKRKTAKLGKRVKDSC